MSTVKWLLKIVIMTSIMLLLYVSANAAYLGSFDQAVASIRGREIVAIPETNNLGEIDPKEKTVANFQIKNLTWHTITITDCAVSCSCTTLERTFPFDIKPGEVIEVKFAIHPKSEGPEVREMIVFHSNSGRDKAVTLGILAKTRH